MNEKERARTELAKAVDEIIFSFHQSLEGENMDKIKNSAAHGGFGTAGKGEATRGGRTLNTRKTRHSAGFFDGCLFFEPARRFRRRLSKRPGNQVENSVETVENAAGSLRVRAGISAERGGNVENRVEARRSQYPPLEERKVR